MILLAHSFYNLWGIAPAVTRPLTAPSNPHHMHLLGQSFLVIYKNSRNLVHKSFENLRKQNHLDGYLKNHETLHRKQNHSVTGAGAKRVKAYTCIPFQKRLDQALCYG